MNKLPFSIIRVENVMANSWFEVERWEGEGIYRREGRGCNTPRGAGASESKEVME